MNWQQPVDIYCERLSQAFWAEPINAFTNIAFFIAAYALLKQLRARSVREPWISWLIAWIAMIGAGSYAFHTLATLGASLLDVIPIGIFIISYIYVFLLLVMHCRWQKMLLCCLPFFLLNYFIQFLPEALYFNGTIRYVPALLYLLTFALLMHRVHGAFFSRPLWMASATLICSMFFRSVDNLWCASWPLGTHFLWHIFNGVALYFAVVALIKFRQKQVI